MPLYYCFVLVKIEGNINCSPHKIPLKALHMLHEENGYALYWKIDKRMQTTGFAINFMLWFWGLL